MTSSKSPVFSYEWPGRTLIGSGVAAQIGAQALSLGVTHLFVLYDPGVSSLLNPILSSITAAGLNYTLFDQVVGNPDVGTTDTAGAAFRQSGADCIVGIGGGSALDMAKGVRLLAGTSGDVSIAAYMPNGAPDALKPPHVLEMPLMIAVPTTSGTGSEVTPWGVLTDHVRQLKTGFGGVNLIPTIALVDPVLTVGLPPFLTAATGMDALSHLIEAFVSTTQNPILDSLILRGVALVGQSLPTAVAEPENLAARTAMMEASMLGGIAISSNYLGACHSLAHQLSTFVNMHHGLACALMLPPQMAFSSPAAPERYAAVARALTGDEDCTAEDAPGIVQKLNEQVGLNTSLCQAGVTAEMIPAMAHQAILDTNWHTNPRPVTEADMAAMYQQVL
jgi:4-hydroxybutyrate dehydrogenase